MRVLVTGASGHIGSALVPELLGAGHQVVGLARSEASAALLTAAGAEVWRGDLADPEGVAAAAASADGVIHLAFDHAAMRSGDNDRAVLLDERVTEALGQVLAGTGKPLVGTSGTLMLTFAHLNRTGTETDVMASGPRIDAENTMIGFAERGIRSSVVRLPPTVHSSLDHHGFIPALIGMARERGTAAYVGEGANRWPAVHTLDAARVYRLALESAPAGSHLHAVGDEGVPFRQIAESIGRRLGMPVSSVTPEEAPAQFGFLSDVVQLDNPTSSRRTQDLLDWHPSHPGLLADLDEKHYFEVAAVR